MKFTEKYYKTLNYSDYLSREDRYVGLAKETSSLLDTLNLLDGAILDYGCAVGFLVNALVDLGYDAYGYDISEWAIEQASKKVGGRATTSILDKPYSLYYCLDVLEHMSNIDLFELFSIYMPKAFIFRIPVCGSEGGKFILEVSEKDPTHINRRTKDSWEQYFNSFNYTAIPINMYTIYNSPGVYCGIGIRY